MNLDELQAKFKDIFNNKNEKIFFAPGRVNLIGEHTDYNGGHVFPCAITQGTYALTRSIPERKLRLFSLNFEDTGIIEIDLDNMKFDSKDNWANYPKGVFHHLEQKGAKFDSGLEILFFGNIPNGAGLSSSASIELVSCIIAKNTYGIDLDMIELVKLSQKVENEFIGVNSGIMDQFIIGMGKKDTALLLDCNTLKYRYVPLILDGYSIIISNTNKKRTLADSKYNERRSQCEAALADIQKVLSIKSLGELTEKEFEKYKHLITDETNMKRARHAVYENLRTLEAVECLTANDLEKFGKLMIASHNSLRDDYDVAGVELDTLVQVALKQKGVIGSRMTGAGFGGCTVSIVKDENIDDFIKNVGKEYQEKIGLTADFYIAHSGDGAHEIL
ncbi:galactokinase [Sebaldella sp. S0638]|uniref:galactokinase n=1 Tax=Sebaldella sp. S0638 TaxID=2957809 RepID=UPI00209EC47D|nr:galactokinase [Sebaldella sp. S0638]MCP1223738.1 galactokinase [Sebaldella sp. S0638]